MTDTSNMTDTSKLSLHKLDISELNLEQLETVSGGLLSNLANMRHEMMRTVANNCVPEQRLLEGAGR